jgi:sulfite reductase (NADPH) flavoprotein alpha-component
MAHAYWHSDCRPPSALPDAISLPWSQLRARLGRSQPVLSYIDLVVYNWKHSHTEPAAPRSVENLELLFPTIGNREERVFYLTQALARPRRRRRRRTPRANPSREVSQ